MSKHLGLIIFFTEKMTSTFILFDFLCDMYKVDWELPANKIMNKVWEFKPP